MTTPDESSRGPRDAGSASPASADAEGGPQTRRRPRFLRLRTIAKQVGSALLTLLVISIVTFAATNVKSPEEVARNALGRETTEDQLQAYLKERGLDRPVHARYVDWLGGFVQGDWGISDVTNRPVFGDVGGPFKLTPVLAV